MKIGLFSGTFDPFHKGHLEVCKSVREKLDLDKVLVLLEKKPHRKTSITSADHRKKIIQLSIEQEKGIEYFEIGEDNVTFKNTTVAVNKKYQNPELFMIIGEDLLKHIEDWIGFADFNKDNKLIVVSRSQNISHGGKTKDLGEILMPGIHESVSSSKIRDELRRGKTTKMLNKKALDYIIQNKVY